MKLLERFHTISPQGIVQPQDLTSLDNCLTWVQISMTFLITFRLNRAAVRYYESRAFCGKLVEMCRSLATHYVTYYEEDEGRDECLRWVLAYPVAVKNYLRGEEGSVMELLGILDHAQVPVHFPPLLSLFFSLSSSLPSPLPFLLLFPLPSFLPYLPSLPAAEGHGRQRGCWKPSISRSTV
eukprot:741946-Hanusia_phi.AAC.1